MSIKLLAIELYRAQQNVARIEAQFEALPLSASTDLLREELRQSQAELQQLRKMLEDKKTSSSFCVDSVHRHGR
jgi:molecular chaperone GrpE (heat shock protein)